MVERGDIYIADLSPIIGSEQGGIRPVVVIQNDLGNHFSPTVIVAAITTKQLKAKLPTHIPIEQQQGVLTKDSVVLLEQIRTIDKKRLRSKLSHLDLHTMKQINHALQISLGMTVPPTPQAT